MNVDAIWAGFLKGEMPVKPVPAMLEKAAEALKAHPEGAGVDPAFLRWLRPQATAPEHERRLNDLARAGTVAVIVTLYPSLAGGPVSQLMKCLAAVKVGEELSRRGAPSAPIAWVAERAPEGFPTDSLSMISEEGELVTLHSGGSDSASPAGAAALIRRLEALGGASLDQEALSLVRAAFLSDAGSPSGCARLYSALMRDWGMPVVDGARYCADAVATPASSAIQEVGATCGSGVLRQMLIPHSLFPSSVWIADKREVAAVVHDFEALEESGVVDPSRWRLWPFAGGTVVDSASRRTLDRYHLDLAQLYSGESRVMAAFERAMPMAVPERLRELEETAESELSGVAAAAPGDKGFTRTAERSKNRIAYQLRRLRNRVDLAANGRQETARRRIHRACNFLAPKGRPQESELAAIHFPLRYSLTVMNTLCERLDHMNPEHQLISLD